MVNWEPLGKHRYYREADLVFFELQGDVSLTEIQHVFLLHELVAKEYGYSLMVFDAHAGGRLGPEARRFVGQRTRQQMDRGASVVLGANFILSALVTLLHNAARLVGRDDSLTHFCATLEEAKPWLAAQRLVLAAKAKQTRG